MKYVVKMFDQYWLRECEDHMEEIYDLEQATQYDSKDAAKSAIGRFTYGEYCKIVQYKRALVSFKKWRGAGMIRRELPLVSEDWNRPFNPDVDGLLEVIKFKLFVAENEMQVTQENYNTWPDSLNEYLSCFYDKESYYEDMDTGKLGHTFQIMVTPGKATFEEFKAQLETLMPYVSYKDDDGWLIFPIFDKDLSAYGTRYLHYDPVTEMAHVEDYQGNLEDCFGAIERYYYYE